MQYNPFMPQDMCPPGMFVGRTPELKVFERCLFQTLNGSPEHFLVEGERGIGKSSLLLYLDLVARGRVKSIQDDQQFRFISLNIDLAKCNHELQIIQKIASSLRSTLISSADLKEVTKAVVDWIKNWEVMQVKFNKGPVNTDTDVALTELVSQITSLCKNTMNLDGVVILIDEADAPEASANLGQLLKMFSERLTRAECGSVMFGLAGLPTLLPKLTESHESSPRLFKILTLEPLEPDEIDRVINLGLSKANERNSVKVEIDADALEYIRDMSEGYPHFLQQFAASAFDANTDAVIDVGDVLEGAFGENGAYHQLGQKFFNEKYNQLISSDDYRTVLDVMAQFGDKWVKKSDIRDISKLKDHTVRNALTALKKKDIIIHDKSRTGYYRMPTRSFAVWVNAAKRRRRETADTQQAIEKAKAAKATKGD